MVYLQFKHTDRCTASGLEIYINMTLILKTRAILFKLLHLHLEVNMLNILHEGMHAVKIFRNCCKSTRTSIFNINAFCTVVAYEYITGEREDR